MILATAQTNPYNKDVDTNILEHYYWSEIAANRGANLILFPEMSLTGYEREEAENLAIQPEDKRLKHLQGLSADKEIIIIAGAPVLLNNKLFIGSFIFYPKGSIDIYTKQYLHYSEELYFTSSLDFDPLVEINNEKASLAICADISNPSHAEKASKRGCTLYLASIFYTPSGISKAYDLLSDYSRKYKCNVLMSNFCGESWNTKAAGNSGFWDDSGNLIGSLNEIETGLLFAEKQGGKWFCERQPVP